jgi:hypothetical protein
MTLGGEEMLHSVLQLLVTAKIAPNSLIPSTLMMEGIRSSETYILTRSTRRHTSEDGVLHSHCGENLKSFNFPS